MADIRKNLLLIMADQLTPMLMGAYGHPVVKTPNLDKLVSKGIRFDAAYSPHPVCAPARACMMTGRYASRIGAYDNGALLKADEPTIAHYLTNTGYECVLSGKMHFVGPDQLHGFKKRFVTNIYPADFRWTYMATEHGLKANQAEQYIDESIHVGKWHSYLSYDEEAHFNALEYIRSKSEKKDTPFFMCVSYHHPHEPFWPPQEFWDMYEGAEIDVPLFPENLDETYSELDKWIREYNNVDQYNEKITDAESIRCVRRAYYALVSYIDKKVGELLDTLKLRGLDKDTVIAFTSDHGDMLCERAMVQKRVFYEWSSRIPLILCYPDGRHAGTVRQEPVSLIDLLPTFLDIAGVPENKRLKIDGRSLVKLLDGCEEGIRESISENPADEMVRTPCFMIRRDSYKYTYIHKGSCQLFNIRQDPGEWNNLAGKEEYAGIESELRERILELFDPEAIYNDVIESFKKRMLIDQAMRINKTKWDAQEQRPVSHRSEE